MKLNYKFKNQGLTLIEALIWFAIFAAVVAGVFSLYSSSRNASNASTVNKELSTIFSQTEQLYASDNTSGLNNTVGLQLGVFPKSLKVATDWTTINNIFGGTVTLTGESLSRFSVIYTNIPSGEICSNIVKTQKAVGWDRANTNPGRDVHYNSTYDIANVAAACGENGKASRMLSFIRTNGTE